VLDPLLHVYEVAPDAVSVADCPEQIAAELTVTVGFALMLTVATAVFEHPDALDPITVYDVGEVGGTTIGLVVEPLLHEYVVAPDAVRVADCPEQIAAEFTVTVGFALILTVATAVFEHPDALDPITVYDVGEVGDTTIGLVVEPLLHEYVVAPDAVRVADCPEQIAAEFTVTVGFVLILTVATAVFEHPDALDPITVYEVGEVGDTTKGLAVDPVLHE
jgi:hypothetical protein